MSETAEGPGYRVNGAHMVSTLTILPWPRVAAIDR